MYKLLISLLMITSLSACKSSDADNKKGLTLIKDGKPLASIVISENASPSAKTGAAILSKWLFEMSGGQIPVKTESEIKELSPDKTYILAGESRFTKGLGCSTDKLGPGGFMIKTFPNALVIMGADDKEPSDRWGTRYGCTYFLETLGCRYLWPDKLGQVIPSRPTITLQQMDLTKKPCLRWRQIRPMICDSRVASGLNYLGLSQKEYVKKLEGLGIEFKQAVPNDWFAWHQLLKLELKSGHSYFHEWDKYHITHPEWFAMQPNGSRNPIPGRPFSPDRVQFCTSNQELIAALAQNKIEELNKTAGTDSILSVSISPNDGGYTTFCQCDNCKRLDEPEASKITLKDWTVKPPETFEYVSLSDRMVHFYNQMADRILEKHPDALITADIYSVYSRPPLREKVHKGLLLRFVGISYASDNARKCSLADWDAWAAAGAEMYWRPNLLWFGATEGIPLNYSRKLAEDFNCLSKKNIIATDFDACINHWAVQGLNYYVLAKLHWQPGLNVDEVTDDYCKSGFGEGWKEIRKYFDRTEELTNEISSKELKVTQVYSPAVIAELQASLDNAAKKVKPESREAQRIDFLRKGMEFTALQAELYEYFNRSKDKNQKLGAEEKKAVADLLDKRMKLMQDILKRYPLAVNVVFCTGREGSSLTNMTGKKPAKPVSKNVDADEQGRVIAE